MPRSRSLHEARRGVPGVNPQPGPNSVARPNPPARLAVMLSGSGRTLDNLVSAIAQGELRATIPLVIASRPCLGADKARAMGADTIVQAGDLSARDLAALLDQHRIDLVVLAGYLRLLDVPEAYRGRIVNIHPALLPAFGGKGMYGDRVHAAVLASGASESGCTVHMVNEQYDRGPIVLQERVPVRPGDDVRVLATRVFEAECRLYPRALQLLIDRGVRVDGG